MIEKANGNYYNGKRTYKGRGNNVRQGNVTEIHGAVKDDQVKVSHPQNHYDMEEEVIGGRNDFQDGNLIKHISTAPEDACPGAQTTNLST